MRTGFRPGKYWKRAPLETPKKSARAAGLFRCRALFGVGEGGAGLRAGV
ncbi:hypothetical protein CLOSTASPAR_04805 [[Clostridium] asparagiforme DSM 15981]|uniref:Uncharacterized protein n=1 Tax=[Clostridium] asparagiforme DSM 15981 TaxID=518636 RepID=C0D6A8_9FIRM|nr:hypothetical protein CLOSTASPAR_04805 [[Clostridium] asparagiforme DSM 15981]